MRKATFFLVLLPGLLAACGPAANQEGLEQCAGNHPADSVAVWFQASAELLDLPYVTSVGAHPTRQCVAIGVTDSMHVALVEERLRRLDVPRDAVVITESTE